MKKEGLPLSLKESVGIALNKVIALITVIIIIIMSIGIFYFGNNFGMGYEYYKILDNQSVLIGVAQEENLITSTIDSYIDKLENEGFYVISSELNINFTNNYALIPKGQDDSEMIKKQIIQNLDVTVLLTKLTINSDERIYYFKSDGECDAFVRKLNEYIEQETNVEGITDSYRLTTPQEAVDGKIDAVKAERERLDAEAEAARIAAEEAEKERQKELQRQKEQVSRGGYYRASSNVSSYSGGAPMASYIYISSPFGYRSRGFHSGVDFASSMGTEVYAWKSGTVVSACWQGGYGNFIVLQHDDGTVSRYAHLSGYAISAGERVVAGQTIGYVGSTGNSTGPHLHFEILINGEFVNPINYL